jgi:hypothetical protein
MGSFSDKLASALGVPKINPPGPIQRKFKEYKKHLRNLAILTPLPETVHLLDENFLYWIKLEHPDVHHPTEWIKANAKQVIPMLEAETFDETGFRMDESRVLALPHIPALLSNPNCIHVNLRHQAYGANGGIRGHYIYVSYYGKKQRKAAFTLFDTKLGKVVLISSFWTHRKWVRECALSPAIYTKPGRNCECHK